MILLSQVGDLTIGRADTRARLGVHVACDVLKGATSPRISVHAKGLDNGILTSEVTLVTGELL